MIRTNLKNLASMRPKKVTRTMQGTNAVVTNIMGVQASKDDIMIHEAGVVKNGARKAATVLVMKQVLGATGTKGTRATVIVVAMIIMNVVASTSMRSRINTARISSIATSSSLFNALGRSATRILKALSKSNAVVGCTDTSLTTKAKTRPNAVAVVAVLKVLMDSAKEKTPVIES